MCDINLVHVAALGNTKCQQSGGISIHSFSVLPNLHRGAWSLSQGARGTSWGTPCTGCQAIAGQNLTHITGNLEMPISLWSEYSEETPKVLGEHTSSVHTGWRQDLNPQPWSARQTCYYSNFLQYKHLISHLTAFKQYLY